MSKPIVLFLCLERGGNVAEIDRLEVQVEAQANKANASLNSLINKLDRVSASLSNVNSRGLATMGAGVNKLANAMSNMNANTKTADFTRLAKNLERISKADFSNVTKVAASVSQLGNALGKIGTVSTNAQQIGELSRNISKLGNKSVNTAISNIPQLAIALDGLMQTLSKTPTVSNNLIQMTNALANLTSQGSKVGTALNSIGIKGVSPLTGWMNRLTSATGKATKATRSFSQYAGAFYANFYLVIRGIKKAWSSVESSMDFLETVNYFEVAMRDIGNSAASMWKEAGYTSAEVYAKSFSERAKELTQKMTGYFIDSEGNATYTGLKSLGMNPDKVLQYQAAFAQITSSIGIAAESTLNFSNALTMLGADWASLRNMTFEQGWEKFASALSGQSRAVRSLGIDITNATLQEYAYKYGLNQAIQEMNQATKAQLRLLAILDQSEVAFGDLANTISSPSNQLRMLRQNFSNLARTIGNLFLPVIQTVLPYINGLVMALQRLFTWIGSLLGVKFESINSSIGGASDGITDLVDGVDDVTSGLGDAGKEAKKLKQNLQSFDELNVISTNDDSSSSSGSGSGSSIGGGSPILDDAIAKAVEEYQKKWNEAFEKMDNKAKTFSDNLTSYFTRMYKATEPFRMSVKQLWDEGLSKFANFSWTALKDFYTEFLVPIGVWAFTEEDSGLTRLVNVINNGLMAINWEKLNTSLKNFWTAIEPYAEQFGEGMIDFFEDVQGLAVDVINAFPGLLDRITDALNRGNPETARKWGYALGVLGAGILAFKGVGKIVGGIAALGTAFASLSSGLLALFGSKGLFASISSRIGKLFAPLIKQCSEMFAYISSGAGTVGEAFTTVFGVGGIVAVSLAALAAGLAYVFTTNEEVRASFSSAVETLKQGLQPVLEFLTGTLLPDLKSGWKGLIKILEPFTDFLNGVFVSVWQDMVNPALSYIGENVLPVLARTFENLWSKILAPFAAFLGSVLEPAIKIVSDIFVVLWKNVAVPMASFIGTTFSKAFTGLSDIFNKIMVPTINAVISVFQFLLKKVFSPIVTFLWEVFKPAFSSVLNSIKKMINGLSETLGGLIDFVTGTFSGNWKKAWNGIKKIFSGIWETMSSGIKSPINGVIAMFEGLANKIVDAFNWIKKCLNKFSIKIPDWVPDAGGKTLGFNLQTTGKISIPRFEMGGFPNTGELFMARENGIPEMVGSIGGNTAVANNNQIERAIASAVENAIVNRMEPYLRQLVEYNRETASKDFSISSRDAFNATRKEAVSYYNRNGRSPFPV